MNGHTWQMALQNFYYLWHHYLIPEALNQRHKPINIKNNHVLRVLHASNPLCKQCQAANIHLSLQPSKNIFNLKAAKLEFLYIKAFKIMSPVFGFCAWLQQ